MVEPIKDEKTPSNFDFNELLDNNTNKMFYSDKKWRSITGILLISKTPQNLISIISGISSLIYFIKKKF